MELINELNIMAKLLKDNYAKLESKITINSNHDSSAA